MTDRKYSISVIGLGLIGGSLAQDWKAHGHHVAGYDLDASHLQQAIDLGLIDHKVSYADSLKNSDVIVLATPVNSILDQLDDILSSIPNSAVVIDMGSTKYGICESIKNHVKRGRFVAAHPLAGTEYSGPKAAQAGLFSQKKFLICDEELCDEDALHTAVFLIRSLGANILTMPSDKHDKHLAYVSHLSHITSFALSLTVLDIEKDERMIQNLAGTGFASTARLAKSSADTWTAIFDANADNLSIALGSYIEHLKAIKDDIDHSDRSALKSKLQKANEIKRILSGLELNILKLS